LSWFIFTKSCEDKGNPQSLGAQMPFEPILPLPFDQIGVIPVTSNSTTGDNNEVDPIVITPGGGGYEYPDPPPGNGGGGGGGSGGDGDGGGGGSGKPVNWNSVLDQKIDALAKKINADIQAKSDKDYYEYGAYLYLDSQGNLQQSPLIRGHQFRCSRDAG
jgi:hypothetical protein